MSLHRQVRGLVLRTQPGAPGIGEIKSFEEDVYIAWKTFGGIETSEIIQDPHHKEIISTSGLKYFDVFGKRSDFG